MSVLVELAPACEAVSSLEFALPFPTATDAESDADEPFPVEAEVALLVTELADDAAALPVDVVVGRVVSTLDAAFPPPEPLPPLTVVVVAIDEENVAGVEVVVVLVLEAL